MTRFDIRDSRLFYGVFAAPDAQAAIDQALADPKIRRAHKRIPGPLRAVEIEQCAICGVDLPRGATTQLCGQWHGTERG